MADLAQLVASNVLILLGLGVAVMALGVSAVMILVRLATRHAGLLWALGDLVVPGHLWRPSRYLIAHLALGLLLTIATAGFVIIAEDVISGGDLATFDLALAEALRGDTSPFWVSTFRFLTWLGNGAVVIAIAAGVLFVLLRQGHRLLAIMWATSQAGAALITQGLKMTFARVRPEGADPVLHGGGWSFPSGHAMGTLVLCGVGIYLLIRLIPTAATRTLPLVVLLTWPVLIGFSRLYLGVHYASDVIAGFLAGLAWVAVCVSGSEVALRRGRTSGSSARPT